MLCVFAIITPKQEYFETALNAVLAIIEKTNKEEGCYQFDVHTDMPRTQLFLYERWHDEAALQFHYKQDYTQEVFASYTDWLDKPVEITKMQPAK